MHHDTPPAARQGGQKERTQALDSAFRAFHFKSPAAGRLNSADRAVARLFGNGEDREELAREERAREIGAAIGAKALTAREIPFLIDVAFGENFVAALGDEGSPPPAPPQGDEPQNSTEFGANNETGVAPQPPQPPPPSSNEDFDKSIFEIFGRP